MGFVQDQIGLAKQADRDAQYMLEYYTALGANLGYNKAMEDAKRVMYADAAPVVNDFTTDQLWDQEQQRLAELNRINAAKRAAQQAIPVAPQDIPVAPKGNPSTARDDAEYAKELYNVKNGLHTLGVR